MWTSTGEEVRMRRATAGAQRGLDHTTAWTLAGCALASALLVRLAVRDFSERNALFHPHGFCYLWLPSLVSAHVVSDLLIGLSYVAISATLGFLVWKARRDLPYSWMFVAFGAFIVACGATHFMEIWTLWTPVFWLSAGVKIVTAAASVITAVALPPLVPRILALVNDARISEQRRLELEGARAELERRVAERTGDLNERTRDLEESQRHYQALAESLPHLVWTCRPDGYCDFLSRQWVEYTGRSAEQQLGYGWAEALHPDDRDRARDEWAKATERGDRFDSEFRIRRADGRYRWFKTRGLPLRNASGEIVKWFGSNTDFDDYKRALASSEQAEERFRLVVEAAPNAMLMADRERRIGLINRKGEDLFGYSREELINQPVELLVPEQHRDIHPVHVEEFLRAPSARPMGVGRELFGRRKDGTQVPIEIGLNPIQLPEGTHTLASIIDVTERKRVEDDLRRSNADLEQFAYIASHDLQEPLRMVSNYTELLAQRYEGKLDEKADKYIRYATEGARRMQRLVADLLEYSRVGSRSDGFHAVKAEDVVRTVLGFLAESIREAGASIEVKGSLPTVLADEGQLSQVFQNLISNAIKFRGTEPLRILVQATPQDGRWTFAVKDNGIGIDMRYADRIFQMFQRLHEKGRYEGSGIGLAITKRIVERHGGRVWIESSEGAGTTFFFTLSPAKGISS
jgi:PAS domain S-box-containing protein